MQEAWIVDAARSPRGIGKIGKGSLSEVHSQRLLAQVLAAIAERNSLNTADVDDVIAGCGTQAGNQGFCIARMAALDAGYDVNATGFTLDRFCGSGLTAFNVAAMGIMSGMQDVVIAGGVDSMSHTSTLPARPTLDSDNLHLRAIHPQPNQGICADLIATLENIDREDLDKLALESQRRADIAIKEGRFEKSIIPIYRDDQTLALDHDEFPRPQTTLEGLAQLKPSFAPYYDYAFDEIGTTSRQLVEKIYPDLELNHVHHAGNSSGVVDGSSAVLLVSPSYAKAHGLKPRARVKAIATAGNSPTLMLDAPVPATQAALKIAGMTMKDIQLAEVNEAFAVVPYKWMRDLDVDPAIVNVNGGAMALGHPIGATGTILIGTLLDEMERQDLSTGLVTLCTGGGMAPATIIERF